MFTIKKIGIRDDEKLFQAAYLIKGIASEPKSLYMIEVYNAAHEIVDVIHYGIIYVMNEMGETVSKYDLGGWELVKTTAD